jgi:hypothetical protein
MQKNPFTEKEDKRLTLLVREALENGDDELMEKAIDEIEVLLYTVPRFYHYVTEDLLGEFYLDQTASIPSIIDSFRLSRCTFLPFFINLIRFRASIFMKKAAAEERRRREILHFDSALNQSEFPILYSEADETVIGEREEVYKAFAKIGKSDLPSLCRAISESPSRARVFSNNEERFFHEYLKKKGARRSILLLLLSTHNRFSAEEIEAWAKVYDVSPLLFDKLSLCLSLWCRRNSEAEDRQREIAIKHWRRMLGYEKALLSDCDRETERELKTLRNRCLKMIEANNENARRIPRGLTICQLADAFDKTPNTVSVAICKLKKELKAKAKELNLPLPSAIIEEKPKVKEVQGEALFCKQQRS